jgi:hypothetical protein
MASEPLRGLSHAVVATETRGPVLYNYWTLTKPEINF